MVKLAADLHKDVAQKVESPPLLRPEDLPVAALKPIPQTRSCGLATARNMSPVSSSFWWKRGVENSARLPL